MAQFQATIRVFDVTEGNPEAARKSIEERLRAAGFSRFQVANLGVQGGIPTRVTPPPRRRMGPPAGYAGGGIVVAAVVAWTIWFLWMLAG